MSSTTYHAPSDFVYDPKSPRFSPRFPPSSTTGIGIRVAQNGAPITEDERRTIIDSIVTYAEHEVGLSENPRELDKATQDAHVAYPANRFRGDTRLVYSVTGPSRAEALIRQSCNISAARKSFPSRPPFGSLTIDDLPTNIVVEAAAKLSEVLKQRRNQYLGDGTALSEVNDMTSRAAYRRRPLVVKLRVAEHDAYREYANDPSSKSARNRFFDIMDSMTLTRGPDTVIGSKAFVLEAVPRYEQIWAEVRSQNPAATSLEYLRIRDEGFMRDSKYRDLRDEITVADTDDACDKRLEDGEGTLIDYLRENELYEEMDKTGESRQELTLSGRSRRLQKLAREIVAKRNEEDQGYSDGEMS